MERSGCRTSGHRSKTAPDPRRSSTSAGLALGDSDGSPTPDGPAAAGDPGPIIPSAPGSPLQPWSPSSPPNDRLPSPPIARLRDAIAAEDVVRATTVLWQRTKLAMPHAIEIGRFHHLPVVELVPGGILLDAIDRTLFLPSHQAPADVAIGHRVEVFLYADREGAPQATTREPAGVLGEFVHLECVSVTRDGAYLAWGVPKDLYVPPDEQTTRMVEGRRYVVVIGLDRKGERLIGSAHLSRHFDYDVEDIEPDDEVDLLVYGHSDAGVQVVVDQRHRGLIHHSDVHRALPKGHQRQGYVRKVRHDNRLDIGLTRRGIDGMQDAEATILKALRAAGGSLPLHDRSAPAEIERALGMSKKAFKRGAGRLYKAKRIAIGSDGLTLLDDPSEPA